MARVLIFIPSMEKKKKKPTDLNQAEYKFTF